MDGGGVRAELVIDDFDGVIRWGADDLGEDRVREVVLKIGGQGHVIGGR